MRIKRLNIRQNTRVRTSHNTVPSGFTCFPSAMHVDTLYKPNFDFQTHDKNAHYVQLGGDTPGIYKHERYVLTVVHMLRP